MNDFSEKLHEYGLEYYGKYYSIYKGIVVDNKDPEFRGRLQIKVPDIFDDSVIEEWCLPKGMFCGKNVGFFAIPNIGDNIWISFENGNLRFPVWEYGWFNTNDVNVLAKVDNTNPLNYVLYTKHNSIQLDDKNGRCVITNKDGYKIQLDNNGVHIESEHIHLGTINNAKEPIVLGDSLLNLLVELLEDIGNVGTITTNTGVTGLIKTSPQWSILQQKWETKFEEFKSTKTKSD